MNIRMNQRRIATREKIESAFIALLQSKAVREITVTEVCELAGVNRSTFYENYADVSALAQEICRRIESMVANLPRENQDYAWLFEYVSANRETFEVYFKIDAPLEVSDYRSAYLRNGIYAVVKTWFENGCQEPAEHMSQLLQRIIHKT